MKEKEDEEEAPKRENDRGVHESVGIAKKESSPHFRARDAVIATLVCGSVERQPPRFTFRGHGVLVDGRGQGPGMVIAETEEIISNVGDEQMQALKRAARPAIYFGSPDCFCRRSLVMFLFWLFVVAKETWGAQVAC